MANESSSTVTNKTNQIGSVYESKKSLIRVPRKGNPFLVETTYTSIRLTKTSNNPPTYRKEIFQHSSAGDGGNTVQIGIVNDKGEIEFNSQLDFGRGDEQLMKEQIQKQLKSQTIDAQKQIKKKAREDFILEKLEEKKKELETESGLGTKPIDELKELQKRKDAVAGTRRTKNTYGVMFYPSFIEKSAQDKLKITILEFAPKNIKREGKYSITKKKQVKASGFIYGGNFMYAGLDYVLGTGKFEDVEETKFGVLPKDQLSFDQRKRMEFQKRSLGHMTLPIPDGVSDANRVNYGNGNLNPLQAGLADAAAAGLMGTGETVTEATADTFNAVTDQGDQVQKIIGAFAAETTLKVNPSELIARTEGQIFNNNLELLFQGPTLRTFNFRYKFSPRDESEIKNVMKIIRAFKQSSAVQRSQSGLFMVTPNTYRLEFKKGGAKLGTSNRHRFLPRIKECALTQCTVDYMPEGSYMTYDSDDLSFQGSMVTYIVTLSFQELNPIFNDDYEDQDLGGIGF